MIACEVALLALLAATVACASYTDVHTGLIYNNLLVVSAAAAVVINIPYHVVWCGAFLPLFLINFAAISVMSIALYACHYWAAGDAKLLMATTLCIPSRILSIWDIGVCPSVVIIAFAFIAATLYTIAESIVLDIKTKSFAPFELIKLDPLMFFASYVFVSGIMTLMSCLGGALAARVMRFNPSLLGSCSFMTTILLIQVRDRLNVASMLCLGLFAWAARIVAGVVLTQPVEFHFELMSVMSVFLGLFVISYASRYNYESIPTSSVRAGQILSLATVMRFGSSRIKGLPHATTEDMRSRITEEEAESIRRWETSKYGQPTILIVKKMPFAIFICLGTVLFVAVEVLMLCR